MYKYMLLIMSFNTFSSPVVYERFKIHASHRIAHSGSLKDSLEKGDLSPSDLLEKDKFGNSLLHYAAYYDCKDNLVTLLKMGFDVNSLNKFKETPLFYAIKKNNQASMMYLLCNGANMNARDIDGKCVYCTADNHQKEIMNTVAVINSVEGDFL